MSRTSRTTTIAAGLAAACVTALGAAPAAQAGQVAQEGGQLVFRAAPGETNELTVIQSVQGGVRIADARQATTLASGPCVQEGDVVRCTPGAPLPLVVDLGDGDDTLEVGSRLENIATVQAQGGPGADLLSGPSGGPVVPVAFDGGAGADGIEGGDLGDTLAGGDGADKLNGSDGDDRITGGADDDVLRGLAGADTLDGGPGFDKSENDWTGAQRISVTLDGTADDGAPGEGDNVVSVEHIYTFIAARLVAAGDPVRFEVIQSAAFPSELVGSPGNDYLRTYDYNDRIVGGGGNDEIEAGNGDDTIDPGPGRDSVNAEAGPGACNFLVCRGAFGNDTIAARDGEVDSVTCAVGNDAVVADGGDNVDSTCEQVDRGQVQGPGPQPGPKATLSVKRLPLRSALARGLRVTVRGAQGKVSLVARHKGRVVARGTASAADGRARVTLRFTKRAKRALGRVQRAKLTISGTGVSRASVTLKR